MNVIFLRVGIFSHVNQKLYEALSRVHHVVANIDTGKIIKRKSLRFSAWHNLLYTIIKSRRYWRQTHSKNCYAFSKMTEYCNAVIRSRTDYDIIFQTQCKFSITENPYSRPYFIYTDLTQKLCDQFWPGWALFGSAAEVRHWYQLESAAYHRADIIFTFSDRLKQSFVEDYHISPDKVIVVGTGINADIIEEIGFSEKQTQRFTMVFVSSEFERQGGPLALKAYELAKRQVPGIELIIIGRHPRKIPTDVTVYDYSSLATIDQVLRRAHIYLMPGKLGGIQSVLQAMYQKCVCIASRSNLLLSDLILDNETGILIRTEEPSELAQRIIELYHNPSWCATIAERAHRMVQNNFTWDKIVARMSQYFAI
ncbi:MAG: glycosyltransferase family 4 protein [candidate division KSB1 bacterium]|nr:glycosyltransferase family 4 protein [candidate division KSB1 bacterium]MDZ7335035.1 glycosyltransferase family 4 protein [candidate division KSB1 bacterium]MDZ7357778.1 glycosyltransferase family 4 protein [candidate division KSB1 bacterium]MDZ7399404.1 glycosyltransferase family 4 protein [candidate division KSB1 bacterium]